MSAAAPRPPPAGPARARRQRDLNARTNRELREQAVDRMVEAALALVASKGAAGLTLVDVGRRAGYSHTLPNYYFKTKDTLLRLAYARSVDAFRARSGAWRRAHAPDTASAGTLAETMRAYVRGGCADPDGARAASLIAAEAATSLPALLPEVRGQNERMLALLQARLAAGARPPGAAERVRALLVLAALRGLVSQHLLGASVDEVDAAARLLGEMLEKEASWRE